MKSFNKTYFKKFISNSPIILDIGCYDGNDSIEFLKIFPDAEIYAFDADSRSISLFKNNINTDKIKLIETAISDTNGYVNFYQSDSDEKRHYEYQNSWSASSSIKKPTNHLKVFPNIFYKNPIKVKSMTLDTWVKKNNLNYVDVIWADLNGGELDFINGATDILQKTKFLFLEFTNTLFEDSLTIKEVENLLPNFENIGIYDYLGNYGNILLKNRKI